MPKGYAVAKGSDTPKGFEAVPKVKVPAGGGVKAAKALSPEKGEKSAGGSTKVVAGGSGAKAVLALKTGGAIKPAVTKPSGSTTPKTPKAAATPKAPSTRMSGTRQMSSSSCANPTPAHAVATPGIQPKKMWKTAFRTLTTLA